MTSPLPFSISVTRSPDYSPGNNDQSSYSPGNNFCGEWEGSQ